MATTDRWDHSFGDANLNSNDGGVATVYCGSAHQIAHSGREPVSVSQLARCAEVYALGAMRYCGTAAPQRLALLALPAAVHPEYSLDYVVAQNGLFGRLYDGGFGTGLAPVART